MRTKIKWTLISDATTPAALRQEGHVSFEGYRFHKNMALLAEGARFSLAGSINIALLTEGGRSSQRCL